MTNNITGEELKKLMFMTKYSLIYEKCYNAYDDIIKTYPTFREDIDKLKTTQIYKETNQNATDKEIVTHEFTLIILTYYLCGTFL
jgi:hypothetical protein